MVRLFVSVLALVLTALPAVAAEPIRIFLAHAQRQEPDSDTAAAAAEEFRRQVDTLSQGRLKVEILAEGVMGGNRDTTALVEKGVIHSALVTLGGVTPVYRPLSVVQLPFAFTSLDDAGRVLDGPFGRKLADDMAATTKLRLMGFVDPAGFHILTNSDRPVRDPDEMWGLRLRAIPGSKPLEAMIRAVGASPVRVSSREELAALATGVADGQMNPPAVVMARGFDRVQRYATLTYHVYVPYVWVFNRAAFEALAPDDAALLTRAVQAARLHAHQLAISLNNSDLGVAGLRKRMQVHTPTAAERAAFREALRPPVEAAIVEEIGADGKRWMDGFKAALRR
ncbi:MAG TPA: TRAP transporter substrate-binding protein DctP [Magnetospirillum sp.]|nr:TRAP transporter substrate-binding protein DctP [Magnetospirillum sp.]